MTAIAMAPSVWPVSRAVPCMAPAERAMMLDGMRRDAPPQAFEAALSVARPHLSQAEWGKLARALNLAP